MENKVWTERSGSTPMPPFGGRATLEVGRNSAVEWGAASLTLDGVFAIMAPVALILAYLLESTGYVRFSPWDKRLAALGGYGSVFVILLLAVVGIVFGLVGMSESRRQQRSIALGLAGVLLNGLDLFLWVGAGLAWHSSAWNML
jgi:hypothetical protein